MLFLFIQFIGPLGWKFSFIPSDFLSLPKATYCVSAVRIFHNYSSWYVKKGAHSLDINFMIVENLFKCDFGLHTHSHTHTHTHTYTHTRTGMTCSMRSFHTSWSPLEEKAGGESRMILWAFLNSPHMWGRSHHQLSGHLCSQACFSFDRGVGPAQPSGQVWQDSRDLQGKERRRLCGSGHRQGWLALWLT